MLEQSDEAQTGNFLDDSSFFMSSAFQQVSQSVNT